MRARSRSIKDGRPINVWETFDHHSNKHDFFFSREVESTGWDKTKRVMYLCWKKVWWENWMFLIILGVSLAIIAMGLDFFVRQVYDVQMYLTNLSDLPIVQGVLYVSFSLAFCLLSVSFILFVSPQASGPGIPEMRCILSGIEIHKYLSVRTFLAKIFGFTSAYAAGFSIGREGPYVHIASIVCTLLTKVPIFKHIRDNDAAFLEVLSAACAAGITCAFGATVGGVLFSIEVTASFYLVGNMWRGFFVSATAATLVKIAHENDLVTLFLPEPSISSLYDFEIVELGIFCIIGLGGGLLGALFVKCMQWIKTLGKRPFLQTHQGMFIKSAIVSVVTSSFAFAFVLMKNDVQVVMKELVETIAPGSWALLIGVFFLKFFLTIFASCSAIPYGIYSPCFLTGAIYGRICGELFIILFPELETKIEMGTYVIIGAAAFSTGVSRTVSTAVMVIELTKQVNLLLPVLIAVLISNSVGRLISYSVYDVLVEDLKLPLMPQFSIYNSYYDQALDIMREVKALSEQPTYKECVQILMESNNSTFPIVGGLPLIVLMKKKMQFSWDQSQEEMLLAYWNQLVLIGKQNFLSMMEKSVLFQLMFFS
eukprot:TRINITY_DN5098_c0_g1_i1.p1 TRINITY_DN5098_c0_g1~~TRINITY_DN5098_c0_g1_i1.p1  ORF type:complete len:595 (+),score=94.49 TRINITY_DN5098_c0_g1_i1:14-1798(+)